MLVQRIQLGELYGSIRSEPVANEAKWKSGMCSKFTPANSLRVVIEKPPLQTRRNKVVSKNIKSQTSLKKHVFKL